MSILCNVCCVMPMAGQAAQLLHGCGCCNSRCLVLRARAVVLQIALITLKHMLTCSAVQQAADLCGAALWLFTVYLMLTAEQD